MDNKKKPSKKKIFAFIFLGFVLIIGMIIGYSSAYFVSEVVNNPAPRESNVTTGIMAIEFSDGPEVKLEKAIPGSSVTKTFTIKNTGTLDAYYDVYLSDLINNFADKTDLVYTLTSADGGANAFETEVPASSSKIVNNKLINPNVTHTYSLKIEFKETNDNQDDNIGKSFSSVVRVTDVNN